MTLPFPATLTPLLDVEITGDPAGQGSMRTFANGGKAYPKNTVNHRNRVIDQLEQEWAGRPPITGPVAIRAVFTHRRPDSHYWPKSRHRRARTVLRDDAPKWHTTKGRGDCDKSLRLIMDALTIARVYDDDSRVVTATIRKPYGDQGSTTLRLWAV